MSKAYILICNLIGYFSLFASWNEHISQPASKLDVVTHIKTIQDIIVGYWCNHEPYIFQNEIESNKELSKIAISQDNKTIAAIRNHDELRLWDMISERKLHTFKFENEYLTDIAYTQNCQCIVVAYHTTIKESENSLRFAHSGLRFFDVTTGAEINRDLAHCIEKSCKEKQLKIVSFKLTNNKIIALVCEINSESKAIMEFEMISKGIKILNEMAGDWVTVSTDGRCILSAHEKKINRIYNEKAVCIVDLTTVFKLKKNFAGSVWSTDITLSADNKAFAALVYINVDGNSASHLLLGFTNAENSDCIIIPESKIGHISNLVFSPDGNYIVYTTHYSSGWQKDGHLRFAQYNLTTQKSEKFLGNFNVNDIAFSSDGNYLALADTERTVKIFVATKFALTDN